jgi:hypothetical protein
MVVVEKEFMENDFKETSGARGILAKPIWQKFW